MNVTPITRVKDIASVTASALKAANEHRALEANPYDHSSPEHVLWLSVYQDRINEISLEVA